MAIQGCEGMPEETFRRLTGVRKRTFAKMAAVLESAETALRQQGGKPNRLTVEKRLQMILEYWREYRTMFAHRPQLRCEREHGVSHDSLV